VPLVEQELLTLPEHLSSPPVFSGVRVTRSLALGICFVDRCLSFCTFSFGHCVVCSSSIHGFWLFLWYLQILHDFGSKSNKTKDYATDICCFSDEHSTFRSKDKDSDNVIEWIYRHVYQRTVGPDSLQYKAQFQRVGLIQREQHLIDV
jgi:hypothetical protein